MIEPKTIMYEEGRRNALDLASRAPQMDGTTHVHRNKHDNNEFPPLTLNVEDRWEDLGEVSLWQ